MISVLDYGAHADGIFDCAPAFQDALDAVAMSGGGTIYVPPGLYRWSSPVAAFFNGPGTSGSAPIVRLSGGGGARILVTADEGAPYTALAVHNVDWFIVEGIKWFGNIDLASRNAIPWPLTTLLFSENIHVRDCEFNGLQIINGGGFTLQSPNALVRGSRVIVKRSQFAAVGGHGQSAIRAQNYVSLLVQDCTFPDFYIINGLEMASGVYMSAAISAVSPDPGTDVSQLAGNYVIVERCNFDEGAGAQGAVWIFKGFAGDSLLRIPHVRLSEINHALVASSGTYGFYIDGARHVDISNWFMREGGLRSKALYADNITSLSISRTSTDDGNPVRAVDVKAGVGVSRLVDSHLDTSGFAGRLVVTP